MSGESFDDDLEQSIAAKVALQHQYKNEIRSLIIPKSPFRAA